MAKEGIQRVPVALHSTHEEYTSKKTGKPVKAEVFKGRVILKGETYHFKLNPNRQKPKEGSKDLSDILWLEVVHFGDHKPGQIV